MLGWWLSAGAVLSIGLSIAGGVYLTHEAQQQQAGLEESERTAQLQLLVSLGPLVGASIVGVLCFLSCAFLGVLHVVVRNLSR